MDDLLLATSPAPSGEPGEFTLDVHPGWLQGRGAFGGLVLGAMARAMEACEPEKDRVLRSITGEIAGPVPVGVSQLRVTTVRRGSGVSTFRAEIARDGEAVAVATCVLGRARGTGHAFAPPAPVIPRWEDVAVVPVGPPFAPEFTQFLEFRLTGPLPFSGAKEPAAAGFVRARRPLPSLGAPEIIALTDAYWPTMFAVEQAPRPMSTLAFTLQYFPPPSPLDPTLPLYYRATAIAGGDGFFVEHRELWTTTGHLLAHNPQTFVWIK